MLYNAEYKATNGKCLNPYSTGSNSNKEAELKENEVKVLILILLEVTQIEKLTTAQNLALRVLILILLEVTQMLDGSSD